MRHLRLPQIYWKTHPFYHARLKPHKLVRKRRQTTATSNDTSDLHDGHILRPRPNKISTPIDLSWYVRKKRHKRHLKCPTCKVTVGTKRAMLSHLSEHTDGVPRACRICRKTFSDEVAFKWHLKNTCQKCTPPKETKFLCTQCPQGFVKKRSLDIHLLGHKRNNCTYCDKVMTKRVQLVRHLLDYHCIKLERHLHRCEQCEKRYLKKSSLYYHIQLHHLTDGQFICLDCGHLSDSIEGDSQHKYEHFVAKKFHCERCGERFIRRQQYVAHLNRHGLFRCLTCNASCASKYQLLMMHKRKGHTVEGLQLRHVCPHCACAFSTAGKLTQHMRKRHNQDGGGRTTTILCKCCKKTFSSPFAYYKHCMTLTHEKCSPEATPTHCPNCQKTFSNRTDLKRHIYRTHSNTNRTPLKCSHCAYSTVTKYNFERHLALHLERRWEFTCEHCGHLCDNIGSLRDHIQYNHVETRDFQCDICTKAFKRNSELVRHKKTHSDVRPFECVQCGKSYKRQAHLTRHQRSGTQDCAPKAPPPALISGCAVTNKRNNAGNCNSPPTAAGTASIHENLLLNLDTSDALNIVDQLVSSFLPADSSHEFLDDDYTDILTDNE